MCIRQGDNHTLRLLCESKCMRVSDFATVEVTLPDMESVLLTKTDSIFGEALLQDWRLVRML